MAATIALTDKVHLGGSLSLAHGTFTDASGTDDANTIAQTDHGLNYIVAHGFQCTTEVRKFRSSVSGGTITWYIDDPADADDGTWWAIGR